jgi:anti-sigma B factor antagonist
LKVRQEVEEGVTVVAAEGVIKLGDSARAFAEHLDRVLFEGSGPVLIDFEGISYMDSTGLGELISYLRRFEEQHRKMALVRPSRRIRALLELTKLNEVFDVFTTRAEAIRFLAER